MYTIKMKNKKGLIKSNVRHENGTGIEPIAFRSQVECSDHRAMRDLWR